MTRKFNGILLFIALAISISGCFGGSGTERSEMQRRIADLNEMGLVSQDKGDTRNAERLFSEALVISESVDETGGKVLSLLNVARLARKNGENQRAAVFADRALKIAPEGALFSDVAHEKALQDLGAENLDKSAEWAAKALQAEQGGLEGRRLNLMARIAIRQGRYQDALGFAEKALSYTSGDEMAEERANSLRMNGLLHGKAGRFARSEEMLGEALSIDKRIGLPAKVAADLEALSEVSGMKGDKTRESDYAERARLARESLKQLKTGGK